MNTYMKVSTMEQLKTITPRQIRNVEKAFDRFEGSGEIVPIFRREHLGGVHVPGLSCLHSWKKVADPKGLEFIKRKYEEEKVEGAEFCVTCGSTCLRENGRLVAFDATFKFSDKPRIKKTGREFTK